MTWDVIRGPQDLIMGRRVEEVIREDWSGTEDSTSHIEGDDEDVQERGSAEAIGGCSSHYAIGEQAHQTLTRSHTDEDKSWGKGNTKSVPQGVTGGSRGSAGERCMVAGDCAWGDMRDPGPVDPSSDQLPCEARGGADGRDMEKVQERMEMPEGSNQDAQALQKRKKKCKSSKEKKRGQANGGHKRWEERSFPDLYRGQSLEEEEEALVQDVRGEGEIREDSQCESSSSSAEVTDIGTSEVDLKDQGQESNGNKGRSMVIEGRGPKEGLPFSKEISNSPGVIKGYSEEHHEECPHSNGSYRDVLRSPGNGCSGSAEGLEMEHGNSPSGDPCSALCRCEREWDGEMEEKNSNPTNFQHVQFVTQNCSAPACPMGSKGPPIVEGCGSVEEKGTWCWCLHLYLGDSEGTPHVEGDAVNEGQPRESGYSMSSTLRVGEQIEERSGDGAVNLGDIPEPLTKKGGKVGETPELQEWVNWWQGWAGSCRAVSGHRRGKSAPAWGCRGEARGEGQKQQDVWVLREWTRRDGDKRGENGPRVSGGEVWVLREQEEGKQDSAWPLGTEDVWVPREPRRQRSAYFMADNSKWTPRSAKPGVSDRGEP